jgi:hypothetical protein
MKRHEFDSLSFISGLVITSIGLVFLLLAEVGDIVNLFSEVGSWFWPLVFIAAGIAVLAPAIARRNDPGDGEPGR